VAISGYYGFHNLGDEAVLYSIVTALRELRPGPGITVLSADPSSTARACGVEAVNRWRPGEVAKALRGCDLLISGGGSLLQDVTGFKSLAYYLGVINMALVLGRPVMFYAQGIGPVRSAAGRRLVGFAARRARAVTVRDQASKDDLAGMGVPPAAITVAADPVLGLSPAAVDPAPGRAVLAGAGLSPGQPGSPLVGISVRPWPGLERTREALLAACRQLSANGARLVFLPLHHPGDLKLSLELAGALGDAAVLRQPLSVPETLSVIGRLDALIGMRLHSLIMAAVMGVPPVGVSYDPKIDRFLGQLGLKAAGAVDNLTAASLGAALDQALSRDRSWLIRAVAPLREQALLSARLVGRLG
jgi:polysaccharide pyruvyl transferase CsaB